MTKNYNKTIYVDADACPVKEEIIDIAEKYGAEAIFVASYAHATSNYNRAKWVYVDKSLEAVDLYIMNHARAGDLVITQDLGLASVLVKKIKALSPRGIWYNEQDMDLALYVRYYNAKLRRAGKYTKGPRPFTDVDRMKFRQELQKFFVET